MEVEGDYYELFLALLEVTAAERGIDPFRFYGDRELLEAVVAARIKAEEAASAENAEEPAAEEKKETVGAAAE